MDETEGSPDEKISPPEDESWLLTAPKLPSWEGLEVGLLPTFSELKRRDAQIR